jgi:hypothetical protein
MKLLLTGWFWLVLVLLGGVTTWASLEKNVFVAFADLGADRWGLATLFDAYFGFFAFWLWTAARTRSLGARLGWLAGIMTMGNFAIATYMLLALRKWDGKHLKDLYATR